MSADPLPSPPCRPPAVVAPAAPATGTSMRCGIGNGACPDDGARAGERPADPLPFHGEHSPLCTTPACRAGCGACCIAPSISSPIPGLPLGKPAGMPCPQLDTDLRCRLFGRPERPAVCSGLQPSAEMCGPDRTHALRWLAQLEAATNPDPSGPAGAAAPPSA